ncbi:MAG: hypothetical protein O3A57_06345 [Bacteroidetes bacterium]|nr:hypothetical protein [Bacteroidota bacterium]
MFDFRMFRTLLPVFLFAAFFVGCDALSSDDPDNSGIVTLTGQVLNERTNNPIENGFIRILPYDLLFEAAEDGSYTFDVDINSTMDLQVTANADGFLSESLPVLAIAGRTIQVPTFSLYPIAEETATSGKASNIILQTQSAGTMGVRESGSEEQVTLTFLLADSVANPVILKESAEVHFRFGAQPGGGELISPAVASTDNNGIATVVVSSGTKAGVVQLIAETTVEGRLIRSQPIAITIHGGLPDQTHFSLGPALRNFPGLNAFGLTNIMSVIVGDKFSNPARVGTAVYFETSHGIIEGSTNTDEQGQGKVSLISANPLPADGVAHITARTADDQKNIVTSTIPVLFSGTPVIGVSPGTAQVNQVYNFSVMDYNGNPLSAGTSISVTLSGTAVRIGGTTSVLLDDTAFFGGMDYEHVVRGPGITQFTFVVSENIDPSAPETPVVDSITISVSGPNGQLEVVLTGSGAPVTSSDDAQVRQRVDGSFEIVMEKPVFNER